MENNTDFTFSCSHCGQHLKAEMDMVGTKIMCPTCGNVVQYVENKHGTVTVKDVQVKLYKVLTVDGGNVVRSGGKNIFEQTLVLRFWWDGGSSRSTTFGNRTTTTHYNANGTPAGSSTTTTFGNRTTTTHYNQYGQPAGTTTRYNVGR